MRRLQIFVCFPGSIFLCLFVYAIAFGQEFTNDQVDLKNISNIYYSDYSNLLALRMYTNTKWNSLDIYKEGEPLRLHPNSSTSLGAGFNYKSYGLALALGLPKSKSSNEKYGETKRFDIQASVYGEKFVFDGFTQIYKGYYNVNPSDFLEWENEYFPKLPNMKVLSFGLNTFYIFNSEKFSYKAAFNRNQIQLKSSGSFTFGFFGHLDAARTDHGFVPQEFPDSVRNDFDLKSFNTIALGLTVGYLYTWVISKHFFLNIGITPGFGNQRIELETINGKKSITNSPAAQLAARSAIGYESKYFFMGITGMVTWRNFQYKGYELDLSTEQLKFFIGKRFDLSKNKKAP